MQNSGTSSGLKASSVAICTRPCKLISIMFKGDGTNASSATLYDNASAASGTAVGYVACKAGDVRDNFDSSSGIECSNGLYLSLTGTGANAIVIYALL